MCNGITKLGLKCKNKGDPFCYIHLIDITLVSDLICKKVSDSKITHYGKLISNSLIKTASYKIFAEPEQSIIEIIVNSIDSYKINNFVGKFGIGFYSILFWIYEDENRILQISSKTIEEEGYTINLQFINSELIMKKIYEIKPSKKGTKITIINPNFTNTNINLFKINAEKLFNIKTCNIFYNGEKINNCNSKKSVYCNVLNNIFEIIDSGCGISEYTLYNSLLIPSSSTKSIISSPIINKLNFELIETKSVNSFHICVGGVSIVNIYDYDDSETFKGTLYNKYIINLPLNSLLPVSREDIIYENNSNELKVLEKQLLGLILLIINTFKDLIPLIKLLNKYIEINKNSFLLKVIIELKDYIIRREDIILIPKNNIYDFLRKYKNFIYYPNPNMYITENKIFKYLYDISNKDIFKLKNVIFMDSDILDKKYYDSDSLCNFIFISKKYANDTPDWINNTILSNPNILLFPINSKFEIELSENFDPNIDDILKISKSCWLRKFGSLRLYDTADNYFYNYVESLARNFIKHFKNDNYEHELIIEKLKEFITYFTNKITNIEFNYVYGQEKIIHLYIKNHFLKNKLNDDKSPILSVNINLKNILFDIKFKLFMTSIDQIPKIIGNNKLSLEFFNNYFFDNYQNQSEDIKNEIYEGLLDCIEVSDYYLFFIIINNFLNNLTTINNIIGIGKYLAILIKSSPIKFFSDTLLKVIKIKLVNPILVKLTEYYINLNYDTFFDYKLQNITNTFTCKSLINYVFNNKITKNYMDLIHNDFIKSSKLQIVEIAVNSGTTKDFTSSILTELFQNSLDAIRSSNTLNTKIEFTITGNTLTIKDYVGFNNYLYILIPFLSSKNPNDDNFTGEMGTGFFNLYRQPYSKKVYIKSCFENICTEIMGTPLLNNSNKVIDIQYDINKYNLGEPNFTEITIFFNENENLVNNIVDISLFIKNYMGILDNIYLNGEKIEKNRDLIYKIENIGEVYFGYNTNQNSIVLTNGVPFMKLEEFCINFPDVYPDFIINCGLHIIINFYKNIYTPTQSRTKIQIKEEKKKDIIEFLNNALFWASLKNILVNSGSNTFLYIYGYHSKAPISQLKFPVSGLLFPNPNSSPKKSYTKILDMYSFGFFSDNSPRTIGTDINRLIELFLENKITLESELDENIFLNELYHKWFENKILIDKPPINNNIAVEFNILNIFMIEYWELIKLNIKKGKIKGIQNLKDEPPKIFGIKNLMGSSGHYVEGRYNINKYTIYLNCYENSQKVIDKLEYSIKKAIKSSEPLMYFNTDILINKYFNPTICTVLLHEIGHALNPDHYSFHGITTITVNDSDFLEFETMATEIYKLCVKDGLITNFLNKCYV